MAPSRKRNDCPEVDCSTLAPEAELRPEFGHVWHCAVSWGQPSLTSGHIRPRLASVGQRLANIGQHLANLHHSWPMRPDLACLWLTSTNVGSQVGQELDQNRPMSAETGQTEVNIGKHKQHIGPKWAIFGRTSLLEQCLGNFGARQLRSLSRILER